MTVTGLPQSEWSRDNKVKATWCLRSRLGGSHIGSSLISDWLHGGPREGCQPDGGNGNTGCPVPRELQTNKILVCVPWATYYLKPTFSHPSSCIYLEPLLSQPGKGHHTKGHDHWEAGPGAPQLAPTPSTRQPDAETVSN